MKLNDKKGIIACFLLAFACLAGGIYETKKLVPILKEGKRTNGVVSDIDAGVKGIKRAVLEFVTARGDTVVTHDLFDMKLIRFSRGERVTVLYHPADENLATVDVGLWMWQHSVFFFSGFILLSVLGIIILRTDNKRRSRGGMNTSSFIRNDKK